MGRFLIVYSHSNPRSYTAAVLSAVQEGLHSKGHSIDVLDLYKEKFDPVLIVDETHRRRDLCRDPATESFRSRIRDADHLVFIYPVWWHGFPAVLKGFIDRVFASEFVYSFKSRPGALMPEGLMGEKRITCFYTLDAPALVALLDPGWFAAKLGIFRYCGFKHVRRFYQSGVKHLDEHKRRKWIEKCRELASAL